MKQRNGMRSKTPMIDSFVKDSKLGEDGDYLNLYLQAQRIERELNEAKELASNLITENQGLRMKIDRLEKGTE